MKRNVCRKIQAVLKDLIAISAVTGVMTLMLYCLFTPQL